MCHTLLQHYIHCRHSNLTFYPCAPYLSPQSNHSPLHPNYIRPDPQALYCRGMLRADGSDGRTPRTAESGGEVEVFGSERPVRPTYSVDGVHPEADTRGYEDGDRDGEPKWILSEWRDHSKPKGVAHSYHRLCPACVEVKAKRRSMAEKARVREERRMDAGVSAWQRAAESRRLAEDREDDEEGGERYRERMRRNAIVGIIGDGLPRGEEQRQIEEGEISARPAEGDANAGEHERTLVRTTREAPLGSLPRENTLDALYRMQVDLQYFQPSWASILRETVIHETERWWERRLNESMTERPTAPFRRLPGDSASAHTTTNLEFPLTGFERQRDTVPAPPEYEQRRRPISTFVTSGRPQPSTRRASTGAMDIMPGIVARGRISTAARRWRWEREGGQYRARIQADPRAPIASLPPIVGRYFERISERTILADGDFGPAERLMNTRPIVASIPPATTDHTGGEAVIRVTERPDADEFRPVSAGIPLDQATADRLMWPKLFLQPDPTLDPTINQITGERYTWNDDRTERTQAASIFSQIIAHHVRVGYNFGELTIVAAAYILPWYRIYTQTEADAANIAFQHLRYIGRWGVWYGRERFTDFVDSYVGASGEIVANAIVRTMAQTEQGLIFRAWPLVRNPGRVQNEAETQVQEQLIQRPQSDTEHRGTPHGATEAWLTDSHQNGVEDRLAQQSVSTDEGQTPFQISGISADLAFEGLASLSVSTENPNLQRGDPQAAREATDVRLRGGEGWDINRVMFRYLWNNASMRQFDEFTEQTAILHSVLSTAEGQQALARVTGAVESSTDARQNRDRHTLMARRIRSAEPVQEQLEIVSPTGIILRVLWNDLTSASSHQTLIIEDILRLVNGDLRALRAAVESSGTNAGAIAQIDILHEDENNRTNAVVPNIENRSQSSLESRTQSPDESVSTGANTDGVTDVDGNGEDSEQSISSHSPTDLVFSERTSPRNQTESQAADQRLNPEPPLQTIPPSAISAYLQRQISRTAASAQSSPLIQEASRRYSTNEEWAEAEHWRQIEDCPDHPSGNNLDLEWTIVCNDATHCRNAEHKHRDKDLLVSTQHSRRSRSREYGRRPYPYDDAREYLTDRTSEILVTFSGCGHANAVYTETLMDGNDGLRSQCGCHSFDRCLKRHKKARSTQMCLDCQFSVLMKGELLDAEQFRELTSRFDAHVRLVTNPRELLLWPSAASTATGATPSWR